MMPAKHEAAIKYVGLVARPYLESGERFIKGFLGRQHISFFQSLFISAFFKELLGPWYYFVLTQENITVMKMNTLMKPIEIKRFPFEKVESVRFQKSFWKDLFFINLTKEKPLIIRVMLGYRSEAEAITSVLIQRTSKKAINSN